MFFHDVSFAFVEIYEFSFVYFRVRRHQSKPRGRGEMASIGGCTFDGGLALIYTGIVPVTGNWLAKAYC